MEARDSDGGVILKTTQTITSSHPRVEQRADEIFRDFSAVTCCYNFPHSKTCGAIGAPDGWSVFIFRDPPSLSLPQEL